MRPNLKTIATLVALGGVVYAAYAEDITISTYYPSPYGSYSTLDTTGTTNLATSSGNVGIGTTNTTADKLVVNGNISVQNSGWFKSGDLTVANLAASTWGAAGGVMVGFNRNSQAVGMGQTLPDSRGNTAVGVGLSGPPGQPGTINSRLGSFAATSASATNNNIGFTQLGSSGPQDHLRLFQASGDFLSYASAIYLYKNFNNRGPAISMDTKALSDAQPVSRLFISSSGNVGIGTGTTTPASKLNLSETTGKAHGAAQGSLILDHENNGGASSIVFRSRVNRDSDYGFIQYQDTATVGGGGESAKLIIGTSNDYDDDVILQPSGNVGIGTTSPTAKLSVVPASNSTGIEVLSPTAGNTHFPYSNGWNYISGNGVVFRNSAMAEKMWVDATSGKVTATDFCTTGGKCLSQL